MSVADAVAAGMSNESDAAMEYAGSALWSGWQDIVVSDDVAYCAVANGLLTLGVSDPQHPTAVGHLFVNQVGMCVDVAGDILCLGTYELGLVTVDVSDANQPRELGSCLLGSSVEGVVIRGRVAFAICRDSLHIVDISDPRTPSVLSSLEIPPATAQNQRSICLQGEIAVIAAHDVYLVNISDLSSPTVLSIVKTRHDSRSVDVIDTLAFVASQSSRMPADRSSLDVINIANPRKPALIQRMEVYGDLLDVKVRSDFAYIAAGASGTAVVDVSDPLQPQPVACLPASGDACALDVADEYAFVCNYRHFSPYVPAYDTPICEQLDPEYEAQDSAAADVDMGDLLILNVSDPTMSTLPLAGVYRHPGNCLCVAVSEDFVFAGDQYPGGISIIDRHALSPESDPVILEEAGPVYDIAVGKDMLVTAGGPDGLHVIDMKDAQSPKISSSINTGYWTAGVDVDGDMAAVAAGSDGLLLLDLSDPYHPVVLSSCRTSDFACSVILQQGYAYVADRFSGLAIIDVRVPEHSEHVSSYPGGGVKASYICLAVRDTLLAGAAGSQLDILSIRDPIQPRLIGHFESRGIRAIGFTDRYLALATTEHGIKVLDVECPGGPRLIAEFDTPGLALDVVTRDETLYVADINSIISVTMFDSSDAGHGNLPKTFRLYHNYPNPFNSSTTLSYSLYEPGPLTANNKKLAPRRIELRTY